jgi:hypothetical protein
LKSWNPELGPRHTNGRTYNAINIIDLEPCW